MPTRLKILIAVAVVASINEHGRPVLRGVRRWKPAHLLLSRDVFHLGSGLSLLTVTNNDNDPVTVRFTVFNGADCSAAGPFSQSLAGNETKSIIVTDFAPAASFPSGVVDMWAVNGSNQPIRFDSLTGTTIYADFGPGPVAATIIPAVKMFSDDRTGTGVIASQNSNTTSAPLLVTAPLILPQVAGGIDDTIVLFSPAVNPGEAPPPAQGNSAYLLSRFPSAGGAGTNVNAATNCVYTNTVTGAFGGDVPTGHITAQPGGGKGSSGGSSSSSTRGESPSCWVS